MQLARNKRTPSLHFMNAKPFIRKSLETEGEPIDGARPYNYSFRTSGFN